MGFWISPLQVSAVPGPCFDFAYITALDGGMVTSTRQWNKLRECEKPMFRSKVRAISSRDSDG